MMYQMACILLEKESFKYYVYLFLPKNFNKVSVKVPKKPSEVDESDYSITNFHPIQYHLKPVFFNILNDLLFFSYVY